MLRATRDMRGPHGDRMKMFEVSKYRPGLMRKARYLRKDWTSCSQIGTSHGGAVLAREEYLRTEQRYVDAALCCCRIASASRLVARHVEHWDEGRESLGRCGLDDIFDGSSPPADGQELGVGRLDNVLRRCLREAAWLELASPRSFVLHVGYDLRMFVAMDADPAVVRAAVNGVGLYVYPSSAFSPTLAEWSS